jgi:hypothetical protein
VLFDEILIGKFSTIDGLPTPSITGGEITTLKEKIMGW